MQNRVVIGEVLRYVPEEEYPVLEAEMEPQNLMYKEGEPVDWKADPYRMNLMHVGEGSWLTTPATLKREMFSPWTWLKQRMNKSKKSPFSQGVEKRFSGPGGFNGGNRGKVSFAMIESSQTFELKVEFPRSKLEFRGTYKQWQRDLNNNVLECTPDRLQFEVSMGGVSNNRALKQVLDYTTLDSNGALFHSFLSLPSVLGPKLSGRLLNPIRDIVFDYLDDEFLMYVGLMKKELVVATLSFTATKDEGSGSVSVPVPSSVTSLVGAIHSIIFQCYGAEQQHSIARTQSSDAMLEAVVIEGEDGENGIEAGGEIIEGVILGGVIAPPV